MRRDAQQALEGLDAIHRYTRQLRRWVEETPPWAAEEDYDALHQAVQEAGVTLGGCYQQWHAADREDSSPASGPSASGPGGPDGSDLPTTADMIGLVPDMTGGRTAVEYVRWLRGDDEDDRNVSNQDRDPASEPEAS